MFDSGGAEPEADGQSIGSQYRVAARPISAALPGAERADERVFGGMSGSGRRNWLDRCAWIECLILVGGCVVLGILLADLFW